MCWLRLIFVEAGLGNNKEEVKKNKVFMKYCSN